MDPRFLEVDEVRIELNIRDQNPADPQGLEILAVLLENEIAGVRPIPIKLHSTFTSVVGEIKEIEAKMDSIVVASSDIEVLAKSHARLLHLYGRVIRMEQRTSKNDRVTGLKYDVEARLTSCENNLVVKIKNLSPEKAQETWESNAVQQLESLAEQLRSDEATNDVRPNIQPAAKTIDQEGSRGAVPKQRRQVPDSIPLSNPGSTADKLELGQVQGFSHPPPQVSDSIQKGLSSNGAKPVVKDVNNKVSPTPTNLPPDLRSCLENLIEILSAQSLPTSNQPRAPPLSSVYPQANNYHPSRDSNVARQPSGTLLEVTHQIAVMGKWTIRFSGELKDVPIDIFLRRIETLARAFFLPQSALKLGLHQLLTGLASFLRV